MKEEGIDAQNLLEMFEDVTTVAGLALKFNKDKLFGLLGLEWCRKSLSVAYFTISVSLRVLGKVLKIRDFML